MLPMHKVKSEAFKLIALITVNGYAFSLAHDRVDIHARGIPCEQDGAVRAEDISNLIQGADGNVLLAALIALVFIERDAELLRYLNGG